VPYAQSITIHDRNSTEGRSTSKIARALGEKREAPLEPNDLARAINAILAGSGQSGRDRAWYARGQHILC